MRSTTLITTYRNNQPKSSGAGPWVAVAMLVALWLGAAPSCGGGGGGSEPEDRGTATKTPRPTSTPRETSTPRPTRTATPTATPPPPIDPNSVRWLDANVGSWRQTATLKVSFQGSDICLDYSKKNSWPGVEDGGDVVNANPWVIVYLDGKWYGGTFEWLRPGQYCKKKGSVSGSYIKQPPLEGWRPERGEWLGFMVSGLARGNLSNVQERSEIVTLQWP
ncbi:MAG: hypothetical protein HYV63_01810 [Candidatus Schekmanbacteria bacterium]|nr:hypothetical protein [Candidatus Schekmanbacteria bacterium]